GPGRRAGQGTGGVSRAVARVDVDVAFGQVAGPEAGGAFAFAADGEANFALGRIELFLQRGLGERRGQAGAADGRALQVDIDLRGIERHAGVSGGGQDASPVGIGAGHGGFDKRRVGDRARDLGGRAVVGGAGNVDD